MKINQKILKKYIRKLLTNNHLNGRLYEYAAQLGISVSTDTTKTGEFD